MTTDALVEDTELFSGGDWIKPHGTGRIDDVSASTEEPIGSVPEGTNADIDAAVAAAWAAFDDSSGWRCWSVDQRAKVIDQMADALDKRGDETARRVSMQNGMPIAISGQLEPVFPQVLLRYYAGADRRFTIDDLREGHLGAQIRCGPKLALLGSGRRFGLSGELLFEASENALLFATVVQLENLAAHAIWSCVARHDRHLVRPLLRQAAAPSRSHQ